MTVLWQPSSTDLKNSRMARFRDLAARHAGRDFADYEALWRWSTESSEDFWALWLRESGLIFEGSLDATYLPSPDPAKPYRGRWFPNIRLNFAENLCAHLAPLPLVGLDELGRRREWTRERLLAEVASFQAWLVARGVGPGDRVAAIVPHAPETIVAMLAATGLGAVWSSCSPDFGIEGIVDRLGQIEPKVLVVADGYTYGGKRFELREKIAAVLTRVPSIRATCEYAFLEGAPPRPAEYFGYAEIVAASAGAPRFERLPFDHPVYVLYSSGTTGKPKCIVHGAGGTLLQHSKELRLHADLNEGDRLLYYTTCGWMMWNWAVSTLQAGATLYTFDGSPFHPSPEALWRIADEERLQIFGASAKYLGSCRTAGVAVERFALEKLRSVLSTGSALLPEDFDWVHAHVRPARPIQLASISGGTDIVSCFMLGTPLKPVRRNEIQARGLGMAVAAFDETGRPVFGEQGELVCTKPFPSMPVSFWNDANDEKYHQAYFARFPGVWHHGDFVTITPEGGVTIHGRSDATLNPGGVRIGTAEVYRYVETHPSVADSLVVGQAHEGDERIVLFVKMRPGAEFNEGFVADLKRRIREGASPRHVPAVVAAVGDIPYTRSGKKVEMAVKSLLRGEEPKNLEALANPEALEAYRRWRNT